MWQKWTFDVLVFIRRYNMLGWFIDQMLWSLDSVRGCLIDKISCSTRATLPQHLTAEQC